MFAGDLQAGSSYGSYGAAQLHGDGAWGAPIKQSPFARRRRPTNLMSLLACFMVPFMVFAGEYSLLSFSMHYDSPSSCHSLSIAILGVVLMLGWMAFGTWRRSDDMGQDPKWYTFVFVTGLVAWICGLVFGNRNFLVNIRPYMDVMSLNVYPDVDPNVYRGQQLMDAGRIIFTPQTHLDIKHSMGFKNLDTYCVAPITAAQANGTNSTPKTVVPSFDFWAVGINCCSGHTPDFHCGEYNNAKARSGLRLMRDDDRAYFRLAVKQAEAAYGIQAPHPIFMYWMREPMSEINAYQDAGYKFWLIGVSVFAGVQVLLVLVAAVVFSKFGL